MGSGQVSRPGMARLIGVCALLLGLFLMHGAPATAAEGCHGAMPSATAHMPGSHAVSTMTTARTRATAQSAPVASVAQAADGSGLHGELCLSTAAQERNPLSAPALLTASAVAVPAAWSPAPLLAATSRARRRGPPAGGRDLLNQVCIART
ncbi:hypothetical protein [Streptomyces sp. NBC_00847]|uniref:hypothetical protein n=1 Tax=unclassified Streptomyces TaxID=2593676 RepID=UPI00225AB301|nr:hypothetical protein [Streptomyces sp. NBC_00847]MCX4878273.1 hypothetical protein [Streptomyces sp. NBC_00847]